eukprot:3951641-Prymnesium_polylepis.2
MAGVSASWDGQGARPGPRPSWRVAAGGVSRLESCGTAGRSECLRRDYRSRLVPASEDAPLARCHGTL